MDRIPAIKRGILRERPLYVAIGWTALAVLAPLAMGIAVGHERGGIEFITVFPAVVLVALLVGWRWAAVVVVLAGLVVNRVFRADPILFYSNAQDAVIVALYFLTCAALIWIAEMARRLVREQQASIEREDVLNHELMHRVKNLLATVNAVAMLTARHSEPGEFSRAFSGRMRALEKATDLLATGGIARCEILQLVQDALAPFHDQGRFTIEGPPCELPREACVPLALALHELCTNASKYGALSTPEGRVSILWTVGEGEDRMLRLVWQERDGPRVAPPKRRGMGTQLLRTQRGLDDVQIDFAPEGVRCEIHIRQTQAEQHPDSKPIHKAAA